ncbi:MAG: type VII toxin-antitoxin system MntA family adenylyltransferase antitoxin [Actinomycetota bacterium]
MISRLDQRRPQIEALCRRLGVGLLYLFSSQARGDALAFSDVDFAALLAPAVEKSQYSEAQETLIVELMALLERNDIDVAVLERASPLLRHRAATEGIVLFEADPETHAEFFVRALREYDDTRSLRAATRAALLDLL